LASFPRLARTIQVIGIFPKDKGDGTPVYKKIKNVAYFPVKEDWRIERVRIQLVDEYLRPIPENPNSNTIVTLHIRSRM
jgi:hypothetical protein